MIREIQWDWPMVGMNFCFQKLDRAAILRDPVMRAIFLLTGLILKVYFEAGSVENLSISEPRIEKHYAYKKTCIFQIKNYMRVFPQ